MRNGKCNYFLHWIDFTLSSQYDLQTSMDCGIEAVFFLILSCFLVTQNRVLATKIDMLSDRKYTIGVFKKRLTMDFFQGGKCYGSRSIVGNAFTESRTDGAG